MKVLNKEQVRNGNYVLHWMQASPRSEYNHALEYVTLKANELNKPLVVFFGITDTYPEANERYYYFMLEGLKEAQSSLEQKGVRMVIWHKSPEVGANDLHKKPDITNKE